MKRTDDSVQHGCGIFTNPTHEYYHNLGECTLRYTNGVDRSQYLLLHEDIPFSQMYDD